MIISSGDAARTGEDGFHSSVVLDPEFSIAGVFGAAGTPSAILLDADGRVASSTAVGAPAVLALAGIEAAVMTG